jgi:dienelactone hydrolase/WD40 repeat protein
VVIAKGLVAAIALAAASPPPPSIRQIVELADLSSVAVSPDGRMVAFRQERASIERNDYDLEWFVVPSDGSAAPRRLAGAGEGDWPDGTLFPQPPIWSPDGAWLYYRALIDGQVQLWRASRDGSVVAQVSHDPGNVTAQAVTSDGSAIVYSAGAPREDIRRAENAEYDGGIRIDNHIDPARLLYRGSRIEGRLASERLTGFWFAHGGLLDTQPKHVRTVDLATLETRESTEAERKLIAPNAQPFDTIDGRQIIARVNAGDARGTVYILASGTHGLLAVTRSQTTVGAVRCDRPQCRERSILSVAWQHARNRLVFATTDGSGNQALHLWDLASGNVDTVIEGKGLLNGGRDGTLGCAITADGAVCVSAAANVPPRLVRIDLDTGRLTVLADPNAGLIPPDAPRFEPLRWVDPKGVVFTGQMLMPADRSGPVPLFVTYYVCDGFLRGGTGDEFPLRQLAENGIAVLCINRPAAEPGFGDQLDQYRLALSGITSGIDLLARRGAVDRQRVGMGGLSFGGEVTGWVLTHSDLLSAASISSTLLTPTYYWFNALAARDTPMVLKRVWKVGDPDTDAARWKEISPALTAAHIKAPLLMQMPEQEFRFNVELAARLAANGTPVDFWAFPNETHVKFQPRHKLAVYQRNLDWFRYWLTGQIDNDQAKRSQYAAWRAFAKKPGWNLRATMSGDQGSPSQDRIQSSTSAMVSTP